MFTGWLFTGWLFTGWLFKLTGWLFTGWLFAGWLFTGWLLTQVGYIVPLHCITNLCKYCRLVNTVINQPAPWGAGWLSSRLVISGWLLHLARLVCEGFMVVVSSSHTRLRT